ncbi:MAG: Uma2 family endonuclease [Bacteroidota bacterium]
MNTVTIKLWDSFTDEEFYEFCMLNDDLHMERDANGNIIIMDLTGSEGSSFNSEVNYEITHWNRQSKKGKVFDPNGGFTLPDSSVRGPDTAWIAIERWKGLPKEDRKRFAHISPDFVIEIRSEGDSLKALKEKMEMYIRNGVRLAWLIDPQNQQTFIYRINGTIELIDAFDKILYGEDVLEGLKLRLTDFWEND